MQNIYVDNVFGVGSPEEGQHFCKESKELFKKAGMNLRDYISNNEELNQFIKKQEESEVEEHTKILELCWNTRTDELALKLPQVAYDESIVWTKRKVLQKGASGQIVKDCSDGLRQSPW